MTRSHELSEQLRKLGYNSAKGPMLNEAADMLEALQERVKELNLANDSVLKELKLTRDSEAALREALGLAFKTAVAPFGTFAEVITILRSTLAAASQGEKAEG